MKATVYYEKMGDDWCAIFERWGGRIRFLSRFPNFGQVSVTESAAPEEGVQEFCRRAVMGGARPESRVPCKYRVTVQG
jgi:hypothetical protein